MDKKELVLKIVDLSKKLAKILIEMKDLGNIDLTGVDEEEFFEEIKSKFTEEELEILDEANLL